MRVQSQAQLRLKNICSQENSDESSERPRKLQRTNLQTQILQRSQHYARPDISSYRSLHHLLARRVEA